MELTNLTPMADEECQNENGGFLQLLFGWLLAMFAVPTVKSLWNSVSGSIKLPGGIESKWDNSKDDSKEVKAFKDNFDKFTKQFGHLIPPFYEF